VGVKWNVQRGCRSSQAMTSPSRTSKAANPIAVHSYSRYFGNIPRLMALLR
jgi:hypothetical protein